MLKSRDIVEILLESKAVLDDDKERLYGHLELQNTGGCDWKRLLLNCVSLGLPVATVVLAQREVLPKNVALGVVGVGLTAVSGLRFAFYDRSRRSLDAVCRDFEKLEAKTKAFLSALREREIALYSIGHSKSAAMCCKTARIACLKFYRDSIWTIFAFSQRLRSSMNYPIQPLEELIQSQPKLMHLINHREIVDDDALSIDGLKNIFHFFSLVRSEMLHFLAIDLIYRNSHSRNLQMIVELCDVTDVLFGKAADFTDVLISGGEDDKPVTRAKKLRNLTRIEYTIKSPAAQRRLGLLAGLEDLVVRLSSLEELPPDCTWLSEGLNSAIAIVEAHQKDEVERQRRLQGDDESISPNALLNLEADDEATESMSVQHVGELPTTLEVFEGISLDKKKADAFDDAENAYIIGEVGRSPYMGVLMDELRTVMKPRTELAFIKEREAIARARNVSVEDVPPEDVFPDLRSSISMPGPTDPDAWLEKPFTYHQANRGDHKPAMEATVSKLADLINARRANDTADVLGDSDSD
uniref:Vezatin domain-containing protein n=1 Tax=Panagrellus redivivus TaxID=6233 RepID=A0A7E4URU7_PANRE